MAAVIGARIASHVKSTLPVDKVTYWSDRQIVLRWLATSKQIKKFLQNRVSEIKTLTKNSECRLCPTMDNPADLLTRGISAAQMAESKLWHGGPEWITCRSKWPKSKTNTNVLVTNADLKETALIALQSTNIVSDEPGIHRIVDLDKVPWNELYELHHGFTDLYKIFENLIWNE